MTSAQALEKVIGRALVGVNGLTPAQQSTLMEAVEVVFTTVASTQSGGEADASGIAAAAAGDAKTSIADASTQLTTLVTSYPAWP